MATPHDKAQILYVKASTLQRLIAEQRVGIWDRSGPVILTFHPDDPDYPGAQVELAEDIAAHAVHRVRTFRMRSGANSVVASSLSDLTENGSETEITMRFLSYN